MSSQGPQQFQQSIEGHKSNKAVTVNIAVNLEGPNGRRVITEQMSPSMHSQSQAQHVTEEIWPHDAAAERVPTSTMPATAEQALTSVTPETAERAPAHVASREPSADDLKARRRYLGRRWARCRCLSSIKNAVVRLYRIRLETVRLSNGSVVSRFGCVAVRLYSVVFGCVRLCRLCRLCQQLSRLHSTMEFVLLRAKKWIPVAKNKGICMVLQGICGFAR